MRQALAPVLAAVALFAAAPALAQNAAEGEKKAAMCIGCHGLPGFQASFPEVHRVPMIAGQNAKYIAASLAAYKKGERKHPTMRGISASLSDADMADLAAFYEQQSAGSVKTVAQVPDQPAVQPAPEVAALLTKGACASCHGANYNKPIDGAYPKLAGQHGDYLFAALRSYGVEGNPRVGRGHPVMVAQVRPFKRGELKAMADYIGALPGDVRTVRQPSFK
jgi:cytochrome c553